MAGRLKRLRRAWLSIHEPRAVNLIIIAVYVGMFLGGLIGLAVTYPPEVGLRVWVHAAFVAALLTGSFGAPAAWRGAFWFERIATIGGMATCVYAFGVALILLFSEPHPASGQLAAITGIGAVGGVGLFATRYAHVKARPWMEGKEPERARAAFGL